MVNLPIAPVVGSEGRIHKENAYPYWDGSIILLKMRFLLGAVAGQRS